MKFYASSYFQPNVESKNYVFRMIGIHVAIVECSNSHGATAKRKKL